MKKFIVSALTLSSLSFATPAQKIALELIDRPLEDVGGQAVVIRVSADGVITGAKCQMTEADTHYPSGIVVDETSCNWKKVTSLSRAEVLQMSERVKRAQYGAIQYPIPGSVNCEAIPGRIANLTANDGEALLDQLSYPCGDHIYNTLDDAKQLVAQLKTLRKMFEN